MLTESRRRDVSTWLGQTRATPRSLTPTADLRLNSQRLNRSSHLRMAADGQRLKRRGSRHPAALKSNHRARNNQTGWELDWDCSYSHPPTPPTWQQSSNRTALSASEQEEENRFSFFTVRFSLRLIARRSKLCLIPQCNTECRSCDLGMSVTGQMSFFKVKSSQNTEQQLSWHDFNSEAKDLLRKKYLSFLWDSHAPRWQQQTDPVSCCFKDSVRAAFQVERKSRWQWMTYEVQRPTFTEWRTWLYCCILRNFYRKHMAATTKLTYSMEKNLRKLKHGIVYKCPINLLFWRRKKQFFNVIVWTVPLHLSLLSS